MNIENNGGQLSTRGKEMQLCGSTFDAGESVHFSLYSRGGSVHGVVSIEEARTFAEVFRRLADIAETGHWRREEKMAEARFDAADMLAELKARDGE